MGERIDENGRFVLQSCVCLSNARCFSFQHSEHSTLFLSRVSAFQASPFYSTEHRVCACIASSPFLPSPLPFLFPFFSLPSNSPLSLHLCLSIKTSIRLGLILKIGDYQANTSSCWLPSESYLLECRCKCRSLVPTQLDRPGSSSQPRASSRFCHWQIKNAAWKLQRLQICWRLAIVFARVTNYDHIKDCYSAYYLASMAKVK